MKYLDAITAYSFVPSVSPIQAAGGTAAGQGTAYADRRAAARAVQAPSVPAVPTALFTRPCDVQTAVQAFETDGVGATATEPLAVYLEAVEDASLFALSQPVTLLRRGQTLTGRVLSVDSFNGRLMVAVQ